MLTLKISDPTLRDGNHAISHQLDQTQIAQYLSKADLAGLEFIEVGHGNGLGASSYQVGKSKISDKIMLSEARKHIKNAKLSVHAIPGFTTLQDIELAIDCGVDAFRIASHCTESDITEKHLKFLKEKNILCYGVLMMSHMATAETLAEAASRMASYGADGIIIMDSAGAYLPHEVFQRISLLKATVAIPIGFHAHNNLGLAVANTIEAVRAGATILDATARGFGAGAGNCQLEVLVPVLHKLGYETGVQLYPLLDAAEIAEQFLIKTLPFSKTMSITTALAGIFSGFSLHIQRLCEKYKVDPKDVVFELGKHQVVAGQEDMILEVVQRMASHQHAT